jgi:hypothetical protein
MGKMTRTRRALIAADMARMLRELQQASVQTPAPKSRPRPSTPAILIRGK